MTPLHWAGVVALAAVTGALAGGAVVWRVATLAPHPQAVAEGAVDGSSDVSERLLALENEVARLERSRPRVVTVPAPVAPSSAGVAPTAAPPSTTAAAVDDPVFEAAVRDVIQRLDDERQAERQAQRLAQQQQTAQRWAASLGDKLRLTDEQKTKLEGVARDFYTAVTDSFTTPDGGTPSPADRRVKMQVLRSDSEQKLGQVLDGSQLSEYQKLDDDLKLSARGLFRGRNGDGG